MVKIGRIALGIGALGWAVATWAQAPQIAAGEWRMTARAPGGPMHYSTCLRGGHITARKILQNEGSHCRMDGPVSVQGNLVTVSEVCRLSQAGGQGAIRVHISARLRLGPGGRSFAGHTRAIVTTALGNVTEHQRITGVRTGPCKGGG
ncbi:MAG: DUF3617 domain-containing protein [Acidiferrobacter sp.]